LICGTCWRFGHVAFFIENLMSNIHPYFEAARITIRSLIGCLSGIARRYRPVHTCLPRCRRRVFPTICPAAFVHLFCIYICNACGMAHVAEDDFLVLAIQVCLVNASLKIPKEHSFVAQIQGNADAFMEILNKNVLFER